MNFHNSVPKKKRVFQKVQKYREKKFLLPILLTWHSGNGNFFWPEIWAKTHNLPLSPLGWSRFLWKAVDKKLSSDSAQGTGPLLSRSYGKPRQSTECIARKHIGREMGAFIWSSPPDAAWCPVNVVRLMPSKPFWERGCFLLQLSKMLLNWQAQQVSLFSLLFIFSSSSHDHTDAVKD